MRMNNWVPNRNQWRTYRLFRFGMLILFSAIPAQGVPLQRTSVPMPASQLPPGQLPAILTMRVEEGAITAKIANSPLQDVLRELAERAGIIFEVRGQENPLVTLNLQRVSLQEAIQRIAPGFNTVFFYDKGQQDSQRITLVQIFPRTNTTPQPSILYLGTGAVTKTNDNIDTAEQAMNILAEGTNVKVREKAVEFLVSTKSEEAVKALIRSISDPAPGIRVAVIEGLAALNVQAALPNILKSLKDPNPTVRQSAATVVALLGNAQNVKDLRPLSKDKDPGVAAAAEMAIRKLSASVKK